MPIIIFYAQIKPAEIRFGEKVITLGKGEYIVLSQELSIRLMDEKSAVIILGLQGALAEKHADEVMMDRPRLLIEAGTLGTTMKSILSGSEEEWTEVQQIRLAFELLLALAALPDESAQKPWLVTDACALIDEEYGYIYGVEDLADRLGVNKAHLIRVFKAEMEITPGDYLKMIRMENARHFLANRDLDLNMVAGLTGYANANYFGKVFKKTYGISPKAYQQAAAEKTPVKEKAIPDELFL